MKKRRPFSSLVFLLYMALSIGATSAWAQTRPDPALFLAPPKKAQPNGGMGVSFNSTQQSYRFSLRSINATRVELLVFTAAKNQEAKVRSTLQKIDDQTWSVEVPKSELTKRGVGQTFFYGYRLWGPNWPYNKDWKPGSLAGFLSDVDDSGNRFNPNKLVFDPYAREISHDPINLGHRTTKEFATGNYRNIDTSLISPKGIFTDGLNNIQKSSARIERPLKDEIIYEAHIRGLTKNHPNIPKEIQGTYKGAIELIPYLKTLGITAIEFLPLQETQNDQNDLELNPADYNYWGYMTLNYFAPDRRYSSDKSPGGPTREFQSMTQAFKKAGIKVYIDVVYNHTAEGGLWSKDGDKDPNTFELYSFRGIDSATYYQRANNLKYYQDNTGIGHNLNAGHPMVSALIVDSLKYWRDLGVDGFRFDLASVLGNTNSLAR